MNKIRILLADDHTIVRKGLRKILSESPEIIVTGETSNGRGVLNKVKDNDYDVVLLDLSMPGLSGLDILTQLKNMKPELPILILSMHSDEQYVIRALRAGASGYITKESAPSELKKAIRKVAHGKKYLNSTFAEKIIFDFDFKPKKSPHETLSDREFQVMCMIGSGKTVSQIANELELSVKTISTHRANILEKMSMKNNAELTYYTLKHSLVE